MVRGRLFLQGSNKTISMSRGLFLVVGLSSEDEWVSGNTRRSFVSESWKTTNEGTRQTMKRLGR